MCDLRVNPSFSNEVPLCFCSTELTRTYTQDGVCLTESGLSQLQSLANAASRRRRSKPKLKLKIINQSSVAVLQTPPDPQTDLSRDGDLDDTKSTASYISAVLLWAVESYLFTKSKVKEMQIGRLTNWPNKNQIKIIKPMPNGGLWGFCGCFC